MSKSKEAEVPKDGVLDLISAVAAGDATREDIVAKMRDDGIDSLDVLVEVLAAIGQKRRDPSRKATLLDLQRMSNPTPPDRAAEIEHRPPSLPFLLRGTLYDPSDVERFNGRDLHFVFTPNDDHLLAFDDHKAIEECWRMSYVSARLDMSGVPMTKTAEGSTGSVSSAFGFGDGIDFGGGGGGGGGDTGAGAGESNSGVRKMPHVKGPPIKLPIFSNPHTNFYEDVNNGGSRLELGPNLAFEDLTEVSYTFFGTGDWNDTISSIELVGTTLAILFEHVNQGGTSFSTTSNLGNTGWFNDLASSCSTF